MKKVYLGWMVVALSAATARGDVVATARSPEGKFPEFRVLLDVEKAPVAVANFMGLADGSQRWVDPETGWVRGGEGDAFYDGMVFDWNAGSVLRGGLRGVEGTDGGVGYTGRPGYTIRSEVGAGGWSEVDEGALAIVERIPVNGGLSAWLGDELDVMHSGGAELGLFLTNGVVPWTVFGHVAAGDEAGLRALAVAVATGATAVEWSVDTGSMTEAERAALEAARGVLPVARGIETRLDGTGLAWELSGKSRLGIMTSTNLMAGWTYQQGMWNEGEEKLKLGVGWGDLGLGGEQGFAAFTEVENPAMAGDEMSGKWIIGVEHTEQTVQYWLDFDGGTGIWATVEGGTVKENGLVGDVRAARETANSIYVQMSIGMNIRFYWFGVVDDGAKEGWFQAAQISLGFGGEPEKDSGRFEWSEGWGEDEKRQKGRGVSAGASPRAWGGISGGRGPKRSGEMALKGPKR